MSGANVVRLFVTLLVSALVASSLSGEEAPGDGAQGKALSEKVRRIVVKDPSTPYEIRVADIHKLPQNLSGADQDALLRLLSERYGDAWSFMTPMEFNAVKNETVIALSRQLKADLAGELSNRLSDMLEDASYDDMWRNYCAQFLGQLYPRMDALQKARGVKLLKDACGKSETAIPGAALISLEAIASADPEAVRTEWLAKEAFSIVVAKDSKEINKTTALQICAHLGHSQALLPARRIAESLSEPVPLRISAIAAVGQLGDASDLPLMEKLKASTDTRLSTAAAAALRRLAPNRSP